LMCRYQRDRKRVVRRIKASESCWYRWWHCHLPKAWLWLRRFGR
jgi:hypothetical protein